MTNHHTVTIEADSLFGLRPTFKCSAPEGADCRLYCGHPDCMEIEEGCPHPGEKGHEKVDVGYCLPTVWLENMDDTHYDGSGNLTVPVEFEWTGETYNWRIGSD